MAKRYTDNDKWDDPFFTELPNNYKLLWIYILDKCDHAGIYKVNPKNAEFALNAKFDWQEVVKVFNGRIDILSPEKWFIPKFVTFQYGELDQNNRVHRSVISILEKEGSFKGRSRVIKDTKDKDKDKDKVKDKDFIGELKAIPAYAHIDIDSELGKMDAWLLAHKGRQKTKRFVLNWLNKIEKPLEIKKPVNNTDEQMRRDREKLEKMKAEATPMTAEQRAEFKRMIAGIGGTAV